MNTAKDFAKALLGFAAFLALGLVLFSLVSCAALAPFLGVETIASTDAKVKAIHEALDVAGPWGSIIATGIGAVLVGANHAYRNSSRKKQLAAVRKTSEVSAPPRPASQA